MMILPESTKATPNPESFVTTQVNCPNCNVMQVVSVNLALATHVKGSLYSLVDNCGSCGKPMVVAVNKATGKGFAHLPGTPF